MLRGTRPLWPALAVCAMLAGIPALLAGQIFSGTALIGATGQMGLGARGRPWSGGAGFDFAVLGESQSHNHMGYALMLRGGYDRVAGYNGGQFEFESQWLISPLPFRASAAAVPVFYLAAAVGARAGAPFHLHAAPGVGMHLSLHSRIVPFVELRRRFPLDASHWSQTQIIFGINFAIAD